MTLGEIVDAASATEHTAVLPLLVHHWQRFKGLTEGGLDTEALFHLIWMAALTEQELFHVRGLPRDRRLVVGGPA